MSRSHHITKAQAVKRYLADADTEAMLKCYEKQTVKKVVRKFRPVYKTIHPSEKTDSKLRGSVAHRAARSLLKATLESKKGKTDGPEV